ncbi:exosortase [Secundilactobacillus oryzae JCM 18671]|uniref:Exosortase n=1 Tax=Secundilactobacillus oryzae JCM 18671 TaxID=1291743 RepID=A0A081BKS9_9LACO|nr:exosortase family protein XrtG [Secundilactobacillus oryzae]GAK48647.1 exosortase [Secundilactobacillus oryzae JCM 18671]
MNVYLILGFIVWLYLLSVLKRAQVPAFYFIFGSAGLFFILIGLSDPYWVWFFTHAVINGVRWIGDLTGMVSIMNRYGLVSINNPTAPLTMSIDYECSGIIETMAFLSLMTFFPIFNRRERVFFGLVGLFWIYAANVLRLAIVIVMVHFMGGGVFFLAHSIIGRMVFYVLVIALYYNVFTFSQISYSLYDTFARNIGRLRTKLKRGETS